MSEAPAALAPPGQPDDEATTEVDEALAGLRPLLLDPDQLVRAVGSGRQRNATVPFRRVELRYVDLKAGRRLQLTSYDDTQAHTRNVEPGAQSEAAVDELLGVAFSAWHVQTSIETVQLRITKKGRPLLHRSAGAEPVVPDRRHDRTKTRKLDESDELFHLLGISTHDGAVKPTRVAKFRQVQDFLAALEPCVDDVVALGPGPTADGSLRRPVRMVDLGCGNAYLTFAALRYLTSVRALAVEATGVDFKAQARGHNSDIAMQLSLGEQVRFLDSTIADVKLDESPDLVLALHACDTATDEALAQAVRWQAPVVLAAPCCHHDLQRQLAVGTVPAAYQLITRHGILSERFADVLTDALRAAILRLVGYRVDVIEFVDSAHTPRNVLIRAVRTGAAPTAETVAAYRSLLADWKVQPALARMLSDDYPLLLAPTPLPPRRQ